MTPQNRNSVWDELMQERLQAKKAPPPATASRCPEPQPIPLLSPTSEPISSELGATRPPGETFTGMPLGEDNPTLHEKPMRQAPRSHSHKFKRVMIFVHSRSTTDTFHAVTQEISRTDAPIGPMRYSTITASGIYEARAKATLQGMDDALEEEVTHLEIIIDEATATAVDRYIEVWAERGWITGRGDPPQAEATWREILVLKHRFRRVLTRADLHLGHALAAIKDNLIKEAESRVRNLGSSRTLRGHPHRQRSRRPSTDKPESPSRRRRRRRSFDEFNYSRPLL